jgi:alpha-mannosidase
MKSIGTLLQTILIAALIPVFPATASSTETNSPLYLLTYDHGGLILWGTDHFADRLRNAMTWLDRYPGFKIGLDNEACVYDYLAEHDPALLGELRGDLKKYAGRFGIGTCTYGQPLSTFINEESNIRQIGCAIKTDRKQLGYTPVIYLMSEHAMHSQIPQILAGFGFQGAIMRTHFMMYGYNPTFDTPIGWWVGLDGTRVPAVPTYPGEGGAFFKTTVDNWFLTRYPGPDAKQSPEDFRKQFEHISPLLATRADDAGLRKEELVRQYDGNPDYHWLLLDELLPLFPKPTVEMKTLPNDFTVRMP